MPNDALSCALVRGHVSFEAVLFSLLTSQCDVFPPLPNQQNETMPHKFVQELNELSSSSFFFRTQLVPLNFRAVAPPFPALPASAHGP